jgi:hypothetical protein
MGNAETGDCKVVGKRYSGGSGDVDEGAAWI